MFEVWLGEEFAGDLDALQACVHFLTRINLAGRVLVLTYGYEAGFELNLKGTSSSYDNLLSRVSRLISHFEKIIHVLVSLLASVTISWFAVRS